MRPRARRWKKMQCPVHNAHCTVTPLHHGNNVPANRHGRLGVLDVKDPQHERPVGVGHVKGKLLVPLGAHAVGCFSAHLRKAACRRQRERRDRKKKEACRAAAGYLLAVVVEGEDGDGSLAAANVLALNHREVHDFAAESRTGRASA